MPGVEIHVHIDPPLGDKEFAFRRLAQTGIYESLARYGQRVDEVMLTALKDNAPVRTGHYRDGIRSVQHGAEGSITYEYRADDPLSRFIIEGTAPHVIEPVKATVLHFITADGASVFTRHVDHPGTKPNDFPSRAWEQARGEVESIMRETGREVWSEVI